MTRILLPISIVVVLEPGCKPGYVAEAFADEPTSEILNEK